MERPKFRRENGQFIVTYKGRDRTLPTMHDAIEYIFLRRVLAIDKDEPIGNHTNTLYPVYSLIPPIGTKVVKFVDLGTETI